MKIFNRLLIKETDLKQQVQKALTTGIATLSRQLQSFGFQNPVYATYNVEHSFQSAFEQNAIFFAVVDRIAEKFGHIPRYVYKDQANQKRMKGYRTKSLDENIADGELMQLLLTPNENQGQDSFFYLCAASMKACGETFIWKNRGQIEGGKPVELYVIPPWCIAPVSDGSLFGISHYVLTTGGANLPIPKEDVIHWRRPRLALDITSHTHLRGFSPMLPMRKIIAQADAITDASVSMYQQGGAKGILYNKTLDNLDTTQKEAIKAVVDKKINNTDVKGAIATIQGDWGYLNVGLSSVDMGLLDADEKVIKKICFALGFPPELYLSDSTFANKEQAWLFFITNTLMPMCASFDGELNRALAPDFKENGRIVTTFADLPEMQTMQFRQLEAVSKLWQLTPNQVLNYIGEEANPNPAMDRVYIPTGYVPIEEASIGTVPPDANTSDYTNA